MPGGLHPPFSEILSWPKPNYDHPLTRGIGLPVAAIILAAVSTIVVALRLYARLWLIKHPGMDDLLIAFGLIFAIYLSTMICIGYYHYSIGRHIWDLKPSTYEPARFNVWLASYGTIISMSCTKISILVFYRRLARGSYRTLFSWGAWIGIGYNVSYCIGWVLFIAFQCNPPEAYWKMFDFSYRKKWTCANEHIALPISGVLSIVGDFYATILPSLLLQDLQVPRKQKLLLYALFATGIFVVGAGIARTVYMDRIINRTYDGTWTLWTVWMWTLVETYLAIICACGPALKPLFGRYVTRTINSNSYTPSKHRAYGTSSRNIGTPSSKNFSNLSRQTHASTSEIIGGAAGLGYEDAAGDKRMKMHIIVQSEIEQVEEEVPAEYWIHATNWPLRDEPWAGGGMAEV